MSNARELAEFAAGYGSGSFAVGKNKIINGAMTIDQRNAGASVTPTGVDYVIDRFKAIISQASKVTFQQKAGSVTPPVGFSNYLGATSTSAYAVGSSDYFMIQQVIEGYNVADLSWGTASAKTVTLSFWVRSSLTGTFGGSCVSFDGVNFRSYPFEYSIASANTWEKKTITIAGDTSWIGSSTNAEGLRINFSLGMGSTYSGTAGSWSSNNYGSATGATSVVGTSGATFYITGVQLEEGSVATPFENRLYPQELALCQRYYFSRGQFYVNCLSATDPNARITLGHPVMMRAAPTATASMAIGTFSFGEVSTIQATYGAFGVGAGNFGLINSVALSAEL